MTQGDEFDIEGEEDEDGELSVRAAPLSPEPPKQAQITAPANSGPPPDEPEKKRSGRPRRAPPPPVPVMPTMAGAPVVETKPNDEWPRDAPGLWTKILEWGASEGRDPSSFVIHVFRLNGPQVQPVRMIEPIFGDQVCGSEEESPGEALTRLMTDVYHMPFVPHAAQYRLEFWHRGTNRKLRSSEPWAFDSPTNIQKLRAKMQQHIQGREQSQFYGGYAPRRAPPTQYFPQMPPPVSREPAPSPAMSPMPPPPAPTGDAYADQYIAHLAHQNGELMSRLDQLQRQITTLMTSPPAVAAGPTLAGLPETEDQRQQRMVAGIAQAVTQTLISTGMLKPEPPAPAVPAAPPPTAGEQGSAISATRTALSTIKDTLAELRSIDKLRADLEGFLRRDDDDDEETVTPQQVIVESGQPKEIKTYRMGNLVIPRFEAEDEAGALEKVMAFFSANPNVTKELANQAISMVMGKLSPDALRQLLGTLIAQGGQAGQAAGSVYASQNGASTYTPPGA